MPFQLNFGDRGLFCFLNISSIRRVERKHPKYTCGSVFQLCLKVLLITFKASNGLACETHLINIFKIFSWNLILQEGIWKLCILWLYSYYSFVYIRYIPEVCAHEQTFNEIMMNLTEFVIQ